MSNGRIKIYKHVDDLELILPYLKEDFTPFIAKETEIWEVMKNEERTNNK